MPKLTLRRVSASTWDITQGHRKVGFARAVPAGFVARIGTHCETASSVNEAFKRTAAKAFGYATPADLAEHNAIVRARQAAQRRAARYVVDQAVNHGNFDPLWKAIETGKL